MAATTQVNATKAWVKLSDGDCTVQAIMLVIFTISLSIQQHQLVMQALK